MQGWAPKIRILRKLERHQSLPTQGERVESPEPGHPEIVPPPGNIAKRFSIPEIHKTVRNNPWNSGKKLRDISGEAREHQLDFCYVSCSIRVSQFYEVVIPKHC
jgi:hypothetical protein